MDLSLPIQAGSSREGGCTGIWVGRPSMMDCKAVHICFPRSRPKERARSVISQGASRHVFNTTDSSKWVVDEDAHHRRAWTVQNNIDIAR